jgi:hypothetical protein
MGKVILYLILLLLVVNCSSLYADASIEDDDIREAVFRYRISRWVEALTKFDPRSLDVTVFFLSVGEDDRDPIIFGLAGSDGRPIQSFSSDPTEEFMKRFADHKPIVKIRSKALKDIKGTKDIETNQRGVIFYARRIKRISDTKVEVEGGHYEDGLSTSIETYYLKKKNNNWVVVKAVTHLGS